MIRIVTDYLENIVTKYSDKAAFVDEKRSMSFQELQQEAYHVAMSFINREFWKKPIVVYMSKRVECVSSYLGIAYSGNFYSPIDTEMPIERIKKIIDKLQPVAIITDIEHQKAAEQFSGSAIVLSYENIQKAEIDVEKIYTATDRILDTDILYVLFTSGSTGIPKGVIVSQKGIVDLTEWISETLDYDECSVMASQTPFYFSFSVYDIYQTIKNGATTYIVPHKLFSFPTKLMEYLDERKINTLVWVPSALTYISTLKALDRPHLSSLKNVFFGGEVMPAKQLNRWIEEYPEVKFVNLYGPTEVTDTCSFYEIDRVFNDMELLPIGEACKNKEIFLLDENNKRITAEDKGKIGELCVRGSGLAYGYYNDPEKTDEVFVQNPLNSGTYKEIIYKTGDLGKYNRRGELVYVSRKDFQIKHKGHRIELSEIDTACSSVEGVDVSCSLYDDKKERIVTFYVGKIAGMELTKELQKLLPNYMLPGKKVCLEKMPYNLNGKIDRQELKKYF